MSRLLDRTFTVKRLLQVALALCAAAVAAWFCAFVWVQWSMYAGGYSAQRSPYFLSVPIECKSYSGSEGSNHWQPDWSDHLFLRFKVTRLDVTKMTAGVLGLTGPCLGWAVVTGSSGSPPNNSFTKIYTDSEGKDVLEVRVRYFQNLPEVLSRSNK